MMAVLPQLVLAQRRVRCEVSGLQGVLVGTRFSPDMEFTQQ